MARSWKVDNNSEHINIEPSIVDTKINVKNNNVSVTVEHESEQVVLQEKKTEVNLTQDSPSVKVEQKNYEVSTSPKVFEVQTGLRGFKGPRGHSVINVEYGDTIGSILFEVGDDDGNVVNTFNYDFTEAFVHNSGDSSSTALTLSEWLGIDKELIIHETGIDAEYVVQAVDVEHTHILDYAFGDSRDYLPEVFDVIGLTSQTAIDELFEDKKDFINQMEVTLKDLIQCAIDQDSTDPVFQIVEAVGLTPENTTDILFTGPEHIVELTGTTYEHVLDVTMADDSVDYVGITLDHVGMTVPLILDHTDVDPEKIFDYLILTKDDVFDYIVADKKQTFICLLDYLDMEPRDVVDYFFDSGADFIQYWGITLNDVIGSVDWTPDMITENVIVDVVERKLDEVFNEKIICIEALPIRKQMEMIEQCRK